MQEAITAGITEIAVAIVSLVVAVVVGYVAKAAKGFLDSKQAKEYSEAIAHFDPAIQRALKEFALAAEAKVASEFDDLKSGEKREWVKDQTLFYAYEFMERTGVKFDPDILIDALLDTALAESERIWKTNFENTG